MTKISERSFDDFFDVPFSVYEPDDYHVSPMKSDLRRMLDVDANPLFSSADDYSYFTAIRDGKSVGRIVVHAHKQSNLTHDTNHASFGFFDCEDNYATAKLILDRAENWARDHGFDEIIGNFNLTAMQQCGVQTGGFERLGFTDMVQNPAHIPRLLEAHGYEPYFPMSTFELDVVSAKFTGKSLSSDSRYEFVEIAKKDFTQHMEEARLVLNDGFARNPMFVPLSSDEFIFQAGEMMTILDPRLSSLVRLNNEAVGVVICIPDLNGFLKATRSRMNILTPFHYLRFRLNRRRAVIIFYSVASAHHGQGIMGAMLDRTVKALQKARYRRLGITWIADINGASLRQMEKLGARPLHKLHLYRKSLTA